MNKLNIALLCISFRQLWRWKNHQFIRIQLSQDTASNFFRCVHEVLVLFDLGRHLLGTWRYGEKLRRRQMGTDGQHTDTRAGEIFDQTTGKSNQRVLAGDVRGYFVRVCNEPPDGC